MRSELTVTAKQQIAPAWWSLTLAAKHLTLHPGQFLLVRCGTTAENSLLLRYPVFPYQVTDTQLCILLRPEAEAAATWLLSRQVSDVLDVLGPFGTGFTIPNGVNNLLLISDSWSIAPLLGQIHQAISRQFSITLALGASRASTLYPLANLPPDIEIQVATTDGSAGQRGQVTDLLPSLLNWADVAFAVGSLQLYRGLTIQAQAQRLGESTGFIYGLMRAPCLPCGIGACFSCVLPTTSGQKFICSDGPVFDLMTMIFDEEATLD